jgi:hypothetical protein
MQTLLRPTLRSAAFASLFALAACGGSSDNNLAALDNELLANGADPALTSALEDQILVDPNLVQQAHPNAVRPPESPVQAQYPAGSAADGARRAVAGSSSDARVSFVAGEPTACGARFDYGAQWANRLPAEFPLYPGARVTEAAGNNTGNCRMRVVTFHTADPNDRVLAHYHALAARAGYSVEQQQRGGDRVLGGTNSRTDGAYYLIVTPAEGGSDVALIVNYGS